MARRPRYDRRFFGQMDQLSADAAADFVHRVLELVPARSVVDLGCGTGAWLAAFAAAGVADVLGVDGPWVPRAMLKIPPERFVVHDLTTPLRLEARFDLALCIEVAEHLAAAAADRLVGELTAAAPAVLFSAAVPGQGGTAHVNEQWPDYWAALFDRRHYVVLDALRPAVWRDARLPSYLRQNVLLFADRAVVAASPALTAARAATDERRLSVVHPGEYARATEPRRMSLRRLLTDLPAVTVATWRRRTGDVARRPPG
ncbi:MAG: class I SAM-dependent methyltransferase [Acidimicrobiales bacterium]